MFKKLVICFLGTFSFLVAHQPVAYLNVCIAHREATLEKFDAESIRSWIIPKKACDKGSGIFGHAWLALLVLKEEGNELIELGHTGETDLNQPTYLESFFERSLESQAGSKANAMINPISVFYEDRYDGKCQKGSGGHIPDEVWSLGLDQEQYDRLINWLSKSYYDFRRYNLGLHQCCHFVIEALEVINIKLKEPTPVILPGSVEIWNARFVVWQDPKWQELYLWTPYALARQLESQGAFTCSSSRYHSDHQKNDSLNPMVRAWQRRKNALKLIGYAPEQIKRYLWLWGWKEVPAPKVELTAQ